MGKREKVIRRATGTVNFDEKFVPPGELCHWIYVVNQQDQWGMVWGYELPDGSVMGYAWEGTGHPNIQEAPCAHCGQTTWQGKPVFCPDAESWDRDHTCPATWDGRPLPCSEPHVCKGRPSMSWHGVGKWTAPDWQIWAHFQGKPFPKGERLKDISPNRKHHDASE